ncbi:MAG: WG repeat-containing protein [Leptospiraceae bacterium]|nr:WG repeat-containing protein [Leptospiraceae bacterium]MCZ8347921.1 WG repeat-containing protein [Leptospiraceae bacterium]
MLIRKRFTIFYLFCILTIPFYGKESTVSIKNPEISISEPEIILKPDRNVKSAIYKNYIYSSLEFQSVYGKNPNSDEVFECEVVSEKSRIENPKSNMESFPSGGFKFLDIRCRIPKKEIFAYHKSIFDSNPKTSKNQVSFLLSKIGWVAYRNDKGVLHEVFNYDNGPDPIMEGCYRIIVGEKMGFANLKGEVLIPAIYDWVEPFENGEAKVCNGCMKVYEGEHYIVKGGKWFSISRPKKK